MLRAWLAGWFVICLPLMFLHFVLAPDVSRSSAWQVFVFYLLALSFCGMWFGWAVHLFLRGISCWRWVALGLVALALSLTLVVGWLTGDTDLKFRSPLVGDLLALFAVLFSFAAVLFRLAWLRSWLGLVGGPAG